VTRRVAVIVKDKDRQYEGLRVSLGLLLERHQVDMLVLDHEISLSEEYLENMSFIDEMGGARFSNHPANVERHGFRMISVEGTVAHLREHDVLIPF
jgi:hypothetical protein